MSEKQYIYFFTTQDMSPEQQIVQTAHVALKLGCNKDVKIDPDGTYFTVVGVRNENALLAVKSILDKFELKYETFYEPDVDRVTSIAVYPVLESKKGPLLAFNLLKV